jgi:alditol oxidase
VPDPLANWAGNVRFRAAAVHRPASVAELRGIVARSARIRALGTGHSFSPIADTTGDLVSLAGLPRLADVDTGRPAVTVSAGLRYSEVAPALQAAGLALANLASLPHISIAGAVATGTHGSGDASPGLAAAVSELELVTADGELVTVGRDADPARFGGLVVALGAAGIVTRLTLRAVPAFTVRQWVYESIGLDAIMEHFDQVMAAAYSVSIFTDWGPRRLAQVWLKRVEPTAEPAASWLGGRLAGTDLHPVAGLPAAPATPQCGVPGPWHERLPHFRPEFTPSTGSELQSEFLLARADAAAAIAALGRLRAELAPVVQVSEIRSVARDDLWLSPCYQRDSVAVHFTWVPDARAVAPVLARVEAALAPLAPRPHWGKISAIPAATVASRYPRLDDFRRLVGEYDEAATFRNEMVDDLLQASQRD